MRRLLPPRGRRFLLPRAETAREILPDGLRADGAGVDAVAFYRNVPGPVDPAELRRSLVAGELDVLTFTSPSTVENFVALLDAPSRACAEACRVAAIGPVTAQALRRVGLAPDVVPARATGEALVAALADHALRAR